MPLAIALPLIGMAASSAASIGAAKIQSNAAKKAQDAQQQGTDRALQAQQQANAPYLALGQQAAGRLAARGPAQPFQGQFQPGGGPSMSLGSIGQPPMPSAPQGPPQGMGPGQAMPAGVSQQLAQLPGAQGQQPQPFNFEAFQKRAQELSAGASGTNKEFQQRIFPQLAQEFGGLERFGSKGDKIRLPNGQVIDAVISAGLGGKGYNWGIEGPARPKPMMSLGSIGQPPPQFNPQAVDAGQQLAPTLDQYSQALAPPPPPAFAPQTVRGPQAMRIPGFATGVQNFAGGPAIVGERGPELLNLPRGSDVIPTNPADLANFGQPAMRPMRLGDLAGTLGGNPGGGTIADTLNRGQLPQDFGPLGGGFDGSVGAPQSFGGGGGGDIFGAGTLSGGIGSGPIWNGQGPLGQPVDAPMPSIGREATPASGPLTAGGMERASAPPSGPMTAPGGPITLGAGGGLPTPAGGPVTLGNGGGMPAIGTPQGAPQAGPQPGPQAGPQSNSLFTPMGAPQDYSPQNVAGPDRLTLGSIGQPQAVNAQQVGPGQQVQAGQVTAGPQVNAERVQGQTISAPGQVGFERVHGPAALQAQQLGPAQQQANLTANQLQLDPSYQFRRDQTIGALENSAFAKGMGAHPNARRALQETAGNLASQEYAAANARNLGVQQQNFQNSATVAGANNAANANAYGLTNQYQQQAQLANQSAGLQSGMFNVQQGQQAQQFNAGQTQQANLANQQAGLSAGQFNSGQQQQASLANVGNALQAGQFNSAQGQQAALANQGANLQAGQFNVQQNQQNQQANIANQLAAYSAYQPLAQQNQQFNASQQSAANQNNFANRFAVNQANNAGSLGAFNAQLGAELGRAGVANAQGQLALGNRSADQSYDLGLRSNALGNRTADQNYGLGLGQLGISQGNLDLAAQGQGYNQDLSTFNTNYGVYRDNRDTTFNQDYAQAQLGAGAAQNYGNQAGNYYSGQGNANGAAAINQGNAYAGALGSIGNAAAQAGAYYGAQQPQQGYGPAGRPPTPYGYG